MDDFDDDIYDDIYDDCSDFYDDEDDYDEVDFDEDDLDEDGLEDDLGEDDGVAKEGSGLRIYEVEQAGMLDGENDSADRGGVLYSSYGMSVDLDELSDEERDRYEDGYMMGVQGL